MHELGVHPIRTFTIGFEESSYSEVDLARQVATRFGTEHHELIVRPDAAALLPKLVHHFGEPFADSTAIPTWYVSQLAGRHVKVVLCGEGGDEILAGYETYRARRFAALYGRLPRAIGGWLVPGIVRRLPVSHARASFDYKAKKFVAGAYLPPAAGHLWWMTMMAEDVKAALYANGHGGGNGNGRSLDPTLRLYEALYRESDGDDLDRLQYIDTTLYLPGDLLAKSDRMSMAHSLEARVPFLDRAVVELARRIPARLRLRHLRTKYMLRRAMAGRLPEPILRQRKLGFNLPLAGWLAGALAERRWWRWWQVAVAAGGFLALLPGSLLVAIAIKLTSRGPILYRGTRIGRGLAPFTIYKFRTLLADAESRIGARLVTPGDPLFTPIGRFLRKYKLDEIPQLLNVVKGDMNMVGPRPVRPIFLATSVQDIPRYLERFRIRPGMTGLAQLRGGYFTHPRDKLRYDRIYLRRRGFWLDFKLVLATFVKLLNRWLTLGLLLALIFLAASFVPDVFHRPFEIKVGGFNLSPLDAIGLLLAGVVLVRQIPAHRLYLYRIPTNRPMVCFVVFSVLAGLVAGDLPARLRDVAYFSASGFLIFFLIVSGEITEEFAMRATRVVAFAAVAVALLGLAEIVVQTHAATAFGPGGDGTPRITATLGR